VRGLRGFRFDAHLTSWCHQALWIGEVDLAQFSASVHVKCEGKAVYHGAWKGELPHGVGHVKFLLRHDRYVTLNEKIKEQAKQRAAIKAKQTVKEDEVEAAEAAALEAEYQAFVAVASREPTYDSHPGPSVAPAEDTVTATHNSTPRGDGAGVRAGHKVSEHKQPALTSDVGSAAPGPVTQTVCATQGWQTWVDVHANAHAQEPRHESCNGLYIDQARGAFVEGVLSGFVTVWFHNGSEYEGAWVNECPKCVARAPPKRYDGQPRRLGIMRRNQYGYVSWWAGVRCWTSRCLPLRVGSSMRRIP